MKKILIEISNDHEMSGLALSITTGDITGEADQWARDLADYVKDNLPATCSGWDNTTHISTISVTDDDRSVTPNP